MLPLACGTAQALTIDAKALARFDVSYTKCEARYPQMQGHRDEAVRRAHGRSPSPSGSPGGRTIASNADSLCSARRT